MSVTYRAVGWNPQKRAYDAWIGAGVGSYLALFATGHLILHPFVTIETVLIRAFGSLAAVLLHVVLAIGPLCRLDARFLPLLYNRRHLGVTTFLAASVHGVLALVQFHAFGDRPVLVSLLTTSDGWLTVERFPFQVLGAAALSILFVLAATSHDFWLKTLSGPLWKRMHMLVYGAYVLVVTHVLFGALQAEPDPVLLALVIAGVTFTASVHLLAALREAHIDTEGPSAPASDPFIDVCAIDDIPDGRARIASVGGERVAIFRYDGRVSAISNVCQHQNGPLGEGRIVRGCVVCPWHGYEYLPDSGSSPPPFTEKVATFAVQIRAGRVFVDRRARPPGTRLEPARIDVTHAVTTE